MHKAVFVLQECRLSGGEGQAVFSVALGNG